MTDLARELKAFIETHAPERGAVSVSGMKPAPVGSSTENWFFDADWGAGPEALLLRRAPKSEVVLVDRTEEFRILERLNDASVPSPRAWWQGELGGRQAMILQKCRGRAERMALSARNRSNLNEGDRVRLAQDITVMLATLHDHPVDTTVDDPVEAALAPYRDRAQSLPNHAAPELLTGLWWLDENRPEAAGTSIVHGDFRPANIMTEDGRISALLDWEFAHVGDPAEDVGWYLADVYRGQHFIPGQFGPSDFLSLYQQSRGVTLDRAAVAWWAVFALQKLATIAVETLAAFRNGDDGRIIQSPDRHLSALMRAVARDGALEGLG